MEYAVHNGPKLKRANLRLTKLNPPGPLLQKNRVKFATSYMLQFSYTVRLFQIKAQFGERFFFLSCSSGSSAHNCVNWYDVYSMLNGTRW